MNWGERLKAVRKEKKMSQRELGERLGVSQQTIAQYEKAQSMPKSSTVDRLADALDVDWRLLQDEPRRTIVFTERDRQKIYKEVVKLQLEEDLLDTFHALNEKGQEKVVNYSIDIYNNPEYRAEPQNPAAESSTPSDQDE